MLLWTVHHLTTLQKRHGEHPLDMAKIMWCEVPDIDGNLVRRSEIPMAYYTTIHKVACGFMANGTFTLFASRRRTAEDTQTVTIR
jgi:hypothetical protein